MYPNDHVLALALAPAAPAPALPPESSIHLLNSLLLFYHHERSWVQRTRASLELALVQGPLLVIPSIGVPIDSQSDTDGSAMSVSSSENATNEPTPATTDSETDQSSGGGSSSSMDPTVKQEEHDDDGFPVRTPLTLRATTAAQTRSSRWLKRKQSFKLHLGPLSSRSPPRGRPEPSAQLLGLFGELLEARMESCLRITRLVRDSNRAMLHTTC